MNAIEVGKKYPGNYHQEGIRLDYNKGFTLYAFLPQITEKEAEGFRKGRYKFALTEKDGILFFLSEFKGAIDVSDSPFHFGLYTDGRAKDLPTSIPEPLGIALNIIAVDSYTGIVKALRLIGLPHEFSERLIDICKKQSKQHIDRYKCMGIIGTIQNEYSLADLYKMAEVECEG